MIQLRFTGGPRVGQVVQLKTAIATAGRAPSCDIVVDDPMVSAIHASLEQVPAGYIVTDQQSANGTLVNGQRIFRALLRIGDEVVFGSTGLKVESSDGFVATMIGGLFGDAPFRASPGAETLMPGKLPARGAVASTMLATGGPSILEVLGAMGQGVTTTPIPPGGIVIGRSPDCGCVVADPQVSSVHCKIVVGPEGPVLTDLGSSNGTFVNEQRLEREAPVLLRDSDSVRVGGLMVRIRAPRPAPVAQPVPVAPPPPEPPRWFVEVITGAPPQRFEIKPGELCTVGRLPTSSIVLSDPQSSGQHAELALQQLSGQLGVVLTDVGSRNGTFVVGSTGEQQLAPKARRPMNPGDIIRIGGVTLRITRLQKTPSVRVPLDASVMSELPVEQHLPKQVRGAKVVFIAGPRAGTAVEEVALERVATRIGRASDNDISLEDPSVSARHCAVVAEERGFVLKDAGSTNGCFVNGERVQPNGERLLVAGDLVRVGLDSVFELRMEGAARRTFAQMSVVAEGGVVIVTPRFVIRGAVVKKPRATIGRDVACDVFIDDPAIARQAIELEFRPDQSDRFFARALAPGALVVNKRTVGEAELATGDTLYVGKWSLRMEVSGARLTVHEAMVPGVNASWAREAESQAQAPVALEGVQMGKAAFSTLFAADQGQLEKLVPQREKKKAAPKWKATSDLLADRNRSVAALIGIAGAAVILVVLFAGKGRGAFLDGELARGHDSQRFQTAAKEHGLKDGCNACHTSMAKSSPDRSARCQACHVGFAPKQAIGAQRGHDHVAAKLACASCHEEHKGAQRGDALVAKASCSKSGCHDARNPPHQKLKPEPATPFIASVRMNAPLKVSMPPGDAKQAQEKLHAIHAGVTHRCMACHTASDGKSEGNATGSCFRCHSAPGVNAALVMIPGGGGPKGGPGGGGPDDSSCLGCHAMHDQTLARGPAESLGPRWTGGVTPAKSGGAAAVAVCALFLLVGGFATIYFKSRVDHVARLALEEPGETRAKATPEGAASGEAVERKNDHAGVKLKVNVNKEKCVGCACCVNACPTAVLEIVSHKSTVTNEASCTSCRECEKVCPSGALTMAPEGAPPRLIDMPDLDSCYQTSVPGLYLIGEAAGKSLVKNACNLGKVVVDHMVATGLRPGDAARLGADVEVLSVGSGPGGLSAAVTAKKHGLGFAVIEKDRVWASTIQYCPKGKEFLAEPFDVKNISHLPIVDTTKEKLIDLWNELLVREGVAIRLGEEVLDIKKEGEVFVVTTSKGITKALKVVLSPGTRGSPRKLGVPGQELEKVSYMLVDPEEHRGHHVMVVGGGDSAVECAMALASQPGNVVTLSYRKDAFARIKPRNLERINQHAAEGTVKVIFNSVPHEVHPDRVVLKIDKEQVEIPNQFIYCLLGADLPMVWLQQLGVKYVKKPEGWNPGPTDAIVVKPLEVAA